MPNIVVNRIQAAVRIPDEVQTGPAGASAFVRGTLAAGAWSAPVSPLPGDIWIAGGDITGAVTAVLGDGIQWNGTAWVNFGQFRGPEGGGGGGGGSTAASALTGTTLASNVVSSSLTSFGAGIALGTPASGALTNCTFPTLNQSTTGNAATATALQTARTINGVAFDGTVPITVPAAAGTLTGATLAAGVTASSITSFGSAPILGTPASGNLTNCTFPTLNQSTTGNAATATALQTPRAINGVAFDGSAAITVPAAAGTLTGATLAAGVTASSLTSVGTITTGVWNGTDIALANIVPASAASVLLGRGASGAGDFQEITKGSGLVFTGAALSASVSFTLHLGAAAGIARTTGGCGVSSSEMPTNRINFDGIDFDPVTQEFWQGWDYMPSNYNGGTVTAEVAWETSGGSGTFICGVQARAFGDNSAIDQAFGTAQTTTDTLIAADTIHITPATPAITIAGSPTAGSLVCFQIYRDVADTIGVDVTVLAVRILYTPLS